MNRLLLAVVALALPTVAFAQNVDWQLDPTHTTVGFTARHLGFAKVNGNFKKFDAKVKADAKTGKISAIDATVDANSVDTDNEKRDAHLKSDDFFAADKHPKMTLVLKSITWKDSKFDGVITLTIRGNTKDVAITGEQLGVQKIDFGGGPQNRTAIEATAKISRKDFGLKFGGVAEGVSIVGDEVTLNFEISISTPIAAEKAAPAPAKK